MFVTVRHFLGVWERKTGETARVMGALTDASLDQPVAHGHRTLGDIAWHLTTAQREIAGKMGLVYDAPDHSAPRPHEAKQIRIAYEAAAGALAGAVSSQWTDETLSERFRAYDIEWKKGTLLLVLVFHEIHHRGQMTVLMRQAGLAVPGVYGPSRDDP